MARPSVRRLVWIGIGVLVVGWLAYQRFGPKPDHALAWAKRDQTAASLAEYVDRGGSAAKARAALRPYHHAVRARFAAGVPIHALLDALAAVAENRVMIEVQSTVERDGFARAEAALGSPPTTYVAPAAAIRWAMLFENEEIDQVWVASRDPVAAVEARLATPVAQGWATVAAVPGGAAVPAGSRSIYSLGRPPQMQRDRCPPCPHGPMIASMCTCLP